MKRLLIVLFFLIIPFFRVTPVFAQSTIPTESTSTAITATPSANNNSSQPNLWQQFWSWVLGMFIKVNYLIDTNRTADQIRNDMLDYSEVGSTGHSSPGSRSTDFNAQNCFKGNVIKKVVLEIFGYPNTTLSKICCDSVSCQVSTGSTENLANCHDITFKDLGHYFVQLQKPFYCNDQNKIVNIEQNIIDKINQLYPNPIPQNEVEFYPKIYEDLYLVPKETTDNNEENTKKIIRTPIPNINQDVNADSKDLQSQLNKNFSPEGSSAGLSGLRPESEK